MIPTSTNNSSRHRLWKPTQDSVASLISLPEWQCAEQEERGWVQDRRMVTTDGDTKLTCLDCSRFRERLPLKQVTQEFPGLPALPEMCSGIALRAQRPLQEGAGLPDTSSHRYEPRADVWGILGHIQRHQGLGNLILPLWAEQLPFHLGSTGFTEEKRLILSARAQHFGVILGAVWNCF